MKRDIAKEAEQRAFKDAEGMKFTTLQEMREYIVKRRKEVAKELYAQQKP